MTYFAFTSLTTVGFGDYHPRSNQERLVTAMILVFGVSIFSLIMGDFIQIVDQLKSFNEDIDEGEELQKFFGLLEFFNNNKDINTKLRS